MNDLTRNVDKLCSGMFSDELDKMGFRHQVIRTHVFNKPLKCCGPIRTVLTETKVNVSENIHQGLIFIESMKEGEILVVSGSDKYAYFGELMSRLCMRQRVGGVVIDGLTRDSIVTRNFNLPVFAKAISSRLSPHLTHQSDRHVSAQPFREASP